VTRASNWSQATPDAWTASTVDASTGILDVRAQRDRLAAEASHVLALTEHLGSLLTTSPTWHPGREVQDALQLLLAAVRAHGTPAGPR
jgi:hypothetical protein